MLKINSFEKEYILNLNKSFDTDYYLTIESRNDNGKVIPWSIMSCSNMSIIYKVESVDKLRLIFNLETIKSEETIIITNYDKETLKIKIKPNLKESVHKVYTFEINGYKIIGKDTIVFKVKSECNGEYTNWKCSYSGKPYEYFINKSNDSIEIKLKSIPLGDIIGFIRLTQEKSNRRKNIQLLHHKEDKMSVYCIN